MVDEDDDDKGLSQEWQDYYHQQYTGEPYDPTSCDWDVNAESNNYDDALNDYDRWKNTGEGGDHYSTEDGNDGCGGFFAGLVVFIILIVLVLLL